MIDWRALEHDARDNPVLTDWLTGVRASGTTVLSAARYGDLPRWVSALNGLPDIGDRSVDLDRDAPRVTPAVDTVDRALLREQLQALHPWRKGPFDIADVLVDAEWRSDVKWRRIAPHLGPLGGQTVLDVGSGNGYFGLRAVGAGAALVLCLDPSVLFNVQFAALKRLFGSVPVHMLPLPDTALADLSRAADTVLSMGVLYHRKSPFDHLSLLFEALKPGGQVLLETLVTDGDEHHVLVPAGRYARMRNVWCLPSIAAMTHWMRRIGFDAIACVDCTTTTDAEQRTTEWMRFESHAHALQPDDATRTIEGLPAPRRASFLARRPR
ncbi:MAG: tRNA 5-methoxyuridine(34)/uridine 5-oxyacetic acid(34) synthase CmoB [Pseudomonadota bacterium]